MAELWRALAPVAGSVARLAGLQLVSSRIESALASPDLSSYQRTHLRMLIFRACDLMANGDVVPAFHLLESILVLSRGPGERRNLMRGVAVIVLAAGVWLTLSPAVEAFLSRVASDGQARQPGVPEHDFDPGLRDHQQQQEHQQQASESSLHGADDEAMPQQATAPPLATSRDVAGEQASCEEEDARLWREFGLEQATVDAFPCGAKPALVALLADAPICAISLEPLLDAQGNVAPDTVALVSAPGPEDASWRVYLYQGESLRDWFDTAPGAPTNPVTRGRVTSESMFQLTPRPTDRRPRRSVPSASLPSRSQHESWSATLCIIS